MLALSTDEGIFFNFSTQSLGTDGCGLVIGFFSNGSLMQHCLPPNSLGVGGALTLDETLVGILGETPVEITLGKAEFVDGLTLVSTLVAGLVEELVIMIGVLEVLVNESEVLVHVVSLVASSIEFINLLFILDLVLIPVELCSLFLFFTTLLCGSCLSCSTAFIDLFKNGEVLEIAESDGLEGGVGQTLVRMRQIMGDLGNAFLLFEVTGDELISIEGERDGAPGAEEHLSIG